jgi:hypothetical protein
MPISDRLANVVQPEYLMALGLATASIVMWHSISLEQNAGFGFFASMRLYQMIGLPPRRSISSNHAALSRFIVRAVKEESWQINNM